jgi:hypothetical protein
VGYLPFLPDFLSGFAFLSLAILVSCGRVDGAQRRRSIWPRRAARAPSAQVDSPKFRRRARSLPGLGVSTESRLNGRGERREIDPETMRDLVEVLEADVAEPALDSGNVGHVESGQKRDVFLREVPRNPQVPNRGPKSDEHWSAVGGHAPTLGRAQTIRP